ncbi:MAG: AMP-binding protein [Candidatus Puniceispirillum sp.]|jgi:fatty-acyl-CoA synthase|uniref:class I adenylate-forming enzyme family protein n=1 Tax=Candidatus Puniceispirillum sp. TaxID=2026719 RepID=UPI001EB363EB|nr:AMP-binding protein [Candidatus Puniceispirillum sp.]MBT6416625.1 AMP-binding protein [Candidatus Puniceispirillum sp.]MBT6567117.1 AMP-binding protein [Candidatus Puniceispirillum sp.]
MRLDEYISVAPDHAHTRPANSIAIQFDNQTITYGDLCSAIDQTAAYIIADGMLKRGDRIAYYGMNNPEIFVILMAAARLGLILVPLNWRLSVEELTYQFADCTPSWLLFDVAFSDDINQITNNGALCRTIPIDKHSSRHGQSLRHLRMNSTSGDHMFCGSEDDPVLLVYTSGTTGRPKGALLAQNALIANAMMSQHAYDMTAKDIVLNILPLFHAGGLNIQPLPALMFGAQLILHQKFDPANTLTTISSSKISLVNCVPTILSALVTHEDWHKTDISSLKMVSIGSTDVPRALIDDVHERNIPLVQIYGATETSPIAIYQKQEHAFATVGSIGKAGKLCAIRLVDEQGVDVPVGTNGEIWVKGDNVLDSYWNNPESTAKSLTDGWFHTSDVARIDENGFYWFVGRTKHLIISGGENIYPAELERVLFAHPDLVEFVVIGRDDNKWGAVPVLVAVRDVSRPLISKQEILNYFEGKIARYKIPKDVVFVDALPRNSLGKIITDKIPDLIA